MQAQLLRVFLMNVWGSTYGQVGALGSIHYLRLWTSYKLFPPFMCVFFFFFLLNEHHLKFQPSKIICKNGNRYIFLKDFSKRTENVTTPIFMKRTVNE